MGAVLTKELVRTEQMDSELVALWDTYSLARYSDIHTLPCYKDMDVILERLFVDAPGSRVLDAGCGRGDLFALISANIRPGKLVAIDWSPEMLAAAEEKASDLRPQGVEISLDRVDLSKEFPWSDGFFDVVVSHMVTCFIAKPWRVVMEEMCRVTREGGWIYFTSFLAGWDFPKIVKKHMLGQFLRSLSGGFAGFRLKDHPTAITAIAKERGLTYPSKDGIPSFFQERGATSVVQREAFWGAGTVVRVQF